MGNKNKKLIKTMSILLHTGDLQKLCRTCCWFLGKVVIAKKHQENVEHIFLINTKMGIPSLHPDKICQKCYCVMAAAIKRKSTIRTYCLVNPRYVTNHRNITKHKILKSCWMISRLLYPEKKQKKKNYVGPPLKI